MEFHFDILPGLGIGSLLFGSTRATVLKFLGEPSETTLPPELDGDEVWNYHALGLSLTFSKAFEFSFSHIAATTPEILLYEIPLIGWKRGEVLEYAAKLEFGRFEPEPYEDELEQVSYPKVELDFWFSAEELVKIEWGHFWNDDATPKWPRGFPG